MSVAETTKQINSFIKRLPRSDVAPPPEDREPIAELVYAFLLWESTTARADHAFKRVCDQFVDFNDLRVSRPVEVAVALGKTSPHLDERIMRLQAALKDLYLREYEVSLNNAAQMSKRDARKYVETLEGAPPFVAARVTLFSLGGHAVPVEQRLLDALINAGLMDADCDVVKAQGLLERYIKAEDGVQAYLKLQHFSETGGVKKRAGTERKRAPSGDATSRKRTPTQKAKTAAAKTGANQKKGSARSTAATAKNGASRKKAARRTGPASRSSHS